MPLACQPRARNTTEGGDSTGLVAKTQILCYSSCSAHSTKRRYPEHHHALPPLVPRHRYIAKVLFATIKNSAFGMVSRGEFTREFPELGYKLELINLNGVCSCGARGAIFQLTMEFGGEVSVSHIRMPAEAVELAKRGTATSRTYVN